MNICIVFKLPGFRRGGAKGQTKTRSKGVKRRRVGEAMRLMERLCWRGGTAEPPFVQRRNQ